MITFYALFLPNCLGSRYKGLAWHHVRDEVLYFKNYIDAKEHVPGGGFGWRVLLIQADFYGDLYVDIINPETDIIETFVRYGPHVEEVDLDMHISVHYPTGMPEDES